MRARLLTIAAAAALGAAVVPGLPLQSQARAQASNALAKTGAAPPQSIPLPLIAISKERPIPGSIFTAIVVTFPEPARVRAIRVVCQATIGGRYVIEGEQKALLGGTYIRPILRSYYDYWTNLPRLRPVLSTVTCGWRIPRSAAGKLISLAPPGCGDACNQWGLTIFYRDAATGKQLGGASYGGADWRVASRG